MTTRLEIEQTTGKPWQIAIVEAFNEAGSLAGAARLLNVTIMAYRAMLKSAGLRLEPGKGKLVSDADAPHLTARNRL